MGAPDTVLISDSGLRVDCHRVMIGLNNHSLRTVFDTDHLDQHCITLSEVSDDELLKLVNNIYKDEEETEDNTHEEDDEKSPKDDSATILENQSPALESVEYEENDEQYEYEYSSKIEADVDAIEIKSDQSLTCPKIRKIEDDAEAAFKEKVKIELERLESTCSCCSITFKNKKQRKSHQRNPKNLSVYYCEECDFNTTSNMELRIHHSNIHKNIYFRFTCIFCSKTFKYLRSKHLNADFDDLTVHIKSEHLKLYRYSCDKCPKKFYLKYNLELHHRREHVTKEQKEAERVQCDICSKFLSSNKLLGIHKNQVHLRKNQYPCSHCDKKLNTKLSLRLHIEAKHSNNQFKCKLCDYETKVKNYFKTHMKQKHDPTFQKYSCEDCDYKAVRTDYLLRHRASKHTNIRYQCDQCSYQATRKQYLTSHLQKIHKIQS